MLLRRLRHPPISRAPMVALAGALVWAVGVVPARAVIIEGDSGTTSSNASVAVDDPPAVTTTWALPGCSGTEQVTAHDPDTHWDRIVLDPVLRLPAGWAPDDLVDVPELGRHTDGQVRGILVDDLVAMHNAAEASGATFDVVSGFRSDAHQDDVYTAHLSTLPPKDLDGPPTVAPPGHSEHQLGTTVDVIDPNDPTLSSAFGSKPAAAWLVSHAAEYGFVLSYPAGEQATSCYGWEPWHLRWVGVDRALQISASGLSPREFLLREAAGELP